MSTTVKYGDVTLKNVFTRSFVQEAVYDDSGTDLLYYKIVVRVLGYVVPYQIGSSVGVLYNGEESPLVPAEQYRELLQHKLMTPRKTFDMEVGGKNLLYLDAAYDEGNGPKPRRCEITQIAGRSLLRVEWEVELAKWACESKNPVLNNRWEMGDEFDENWYCTRTISGRLRISALRDSPEHKTAKYHPQMFRYLVVPPLQDGFKRQSMRFATTRDGLSMDYTIVDRQVKAACPFPGTSWSGTHTISTADGVNTFSELSVSVKGPPKADKKVLIQLAAQIAQSKLKVSQQNFIAQGYLIEQVAIIDHLEDNEVDLRMRIRQTPSDVPKYFTTDLSKIGQPLELNDYDPLKSRVPKQEDLPPLAAAFVCYLQSPCDYEHGVSQSTAEDGDGYGTDEDTEITYDEGGAYLDDEYDASWSKEHKESMYVFYRVKSRYVSNPLRVQLPVAKSYQEDEEAARVVTLGGAAAKRIIEISAERAGDWPRIPALEDYDDESGQAKLLRHEVEPGEVRVGPDGKTKIYPVIAKLVYALPRPPRAGEHRTVELPWVAHSEADAIPESQYQLKLS